MPSASEKLGKANAQGETLVSTNLVEKNSLVSFSFMYTILILTFDFILNIHDI
jgi:hypothetical protein